jgi:hypothetical protein
MSDPFSNHESGLTSPIRNTAAVTPNDSVDLPTVSRALYIGTGGTITVTMQGGMVEEFVGVLAGIWYPYSVKRVWATGTTAGSIVALL